MPLNPHLAIELGDITTVEADVVALKYARAFHGADWAVAKLLGEGGVPESRLMPEVGACAYVETYGRIVSPHALFVGVTSLLSFSYPQIRAFAREVLAFLSREAPGTRHLAMTIHGPGYGLDEVEACVAQINGYQDALNDGMAPPSLERITIVEREPDRVRRLVEATEQRMVSARHINPMHSPGVFPLLDPFSPPVVSGAVSGAVRGATAVNANRVDVPASAKALAFVAMPFSKQMEDVFYYGIQGAVHACGLVCERSDHTAFVGGIVDHIRARIKASSVVIADLTGGNANVCLEVGYAWGTGRPTVLLAQSTEDLFFDVRGHKCLRYDGIRDLEASLTKELQALKASGTI